MPSLKESLANQERRLSFYQRTYPELNGAVGTVTGPPAESGRVPVRIDAPQSGQMLLKPENLEVRDEE